MRVIPVRSPWLQLVVVFGGFLAGPFAALGVATALTPDSTFVQSLSVMAFALIFAGGSLLWLGLGFAAIAMGFLWNAARGRPPAPALVGRSDRVVPPGYRGYVVLGVVVGLLLGLLAGLVTELSLLVAVAVWTLLGWAYGALLWAAAHHGYLPFDPE